MFWGKTYSFQGDRCWNITIFKTQIQSVCQIIRADWWLAGTIPLLVSSLFRIVGSWPNNRKFITSLFKGCGQSSLDFKERLESAAASQYWSHMVMGDVVLSTQLIFKNSWALILSHNEFIICWERLMFIEVCDYIMKQCKYLYLKIHINEIHNYGEWNVITTSEFEYTYLIKSLPEETKECLLS